MLISHFGRGKDKKQRKRRGTSSWRSNLANTIDPNRKPKRTIGGTAETVGKVADAVGKVGTVAALGYGAVKGRKSLGRMLNNLEAVTNIAKNTTDKVGRQVTSATKQARSTATRVNQDTLKASQNMVDASKDIKTTTGYIPNTVSRTQQSLKNIGNTVKKQNQKREKI